MQIADKGGGDIIAIIWLKNCSVCCCLVCVFDPLSLTFFSKCLDQDQEGEEEEEVVLGGELLVGEAIQMTE